MINYVIKAKSLTRCKSWDLYPEATYFNQIKDYFEKDFEKCDYVLFSIDKSEISNPKILKNFLKIIENCLKYDFDIKVCVDADVYKQKEDGHIEYVWTEEQTKNIFEFDKKLKDMGMKQDIYVNEFKKVSSFKDFEQSWTLSQIVEVNKKLDKIVDFIKSKNFTPFEAMLFIHDYVAKKYEYKGSHENLEKASSLPSIYYDKLIKCTGYSSLVKVIIDKLEMPGLKCEQLCCAFINNNEEISGHAQNLIHIKDEKYDVCGSYIDDACHDCKNISNDNSVKGRYNRGFSHCLFSVNDLNFIQGKKYNQFFLKNRGDFFVTRNAYWFKNKNQVLKKYKDRSPQIPLETFEKGLMAYYTKTKGEIDAEREVKKAISRSVKNSVFFNPNAQNCFRRLRNELIVQKNIQTNFDHETENVLKQIENDNNQNINLV